MIFISYSSKDYDKASELRATLEENGMECWMAPESIPAGSNYTNEIPNAIKKCTTFIILLSDSSQSSVWVPKELDLAIGENKSIVPIKIDDSEIPYSIDFYLKNIQIIKAPASLKSAYLWVPHNEKKITFSKKGQQQFIKEFAKNHVAKNAICVDEPTTQVVQNSTPKVLSATDGTQTPSSQKVVTQTDNDTATIVYMDGRTYLGEFSNGVMGKGTFIWPNGDEYTGCFKENKMNDRRGKFKFADGRTYIGEVKDDKITGSGTITFPNRETYSGPCINGKPHGYGNYTFEDRTTYTCKFVDGVLDKKLEKLY